MIDGQRLEIRGSTRRYFNWSTEYRCTSCGHDHRKHWEQREDYAIPDDLTGKPILYDARRVLRQGCDVCGCEGLAG